MVQLIKFGFIHQEVIMKYTKLQRALAFLGIVILVGMYLVTLILGLTGSKDTVGLLMASFACTVIIPGLIYGMMLVSRVLSGRGVSSEDSSDSSENGNEVSEKDSDQ